MLLYFWRSLTAYSPTVAHAWPTVDIGLRHLLIDSAILPGAARRKNGAIVNPPFSPKSRLHRDSRIVGGGATSQTTE